MTDFDMAQYRLERGDKYPYDATDLEYQAEKLPPAKDWAHRAARGVIADLCDRRDIKRGFEHVDEDVRIELVGRLAEIIRLSHAPAPSELSRGWQDISTAPENTKVLAAYRNENGKWRIITACYHTQLEWSDEYGDHEEEFAPEAWYEENDSSEVIYQTSRKPTHWQPLPVPPSLAASEGSTDA